MKNLELYAYVRRTVKQLEEIIKESYDAGYMDSVDKDKAQSGLDQFYQVCEDKLNV